MRHGKALILAYVSVVTGQITWDNTDTCTPATTPRCDQAMHGLYDKSVTTVTSASIKVPEGVRRCKLTWDSLAYDSRDGESDNLEIKSNGGEFRTLWSQTIQMYCKTKSGSGKPVGGCPAEWTDLGCDEKWSCKPWEDGCHPRRCMYSGSVEFDCTNSLVLRFRSGTDETGEGFAFGNLVLTMGDTVITDLPKEGEVGSGDATIWPPPPSPLSKCTGEVARVLACIQKFSSADWPGCKSDGRFECSCDNDDGVDWCCGNSDQKAAIAIWEARGRCSAGEQGRKGDDEAEEEDEGPGQGWPDHAGVPCYFLWVVAVLYSCCSMQSAVRRAKAARTQQALDSTKRNWQNAKKWSFRVFLVCTLIHFVSASWLGVDWIPLALGPCVLLGVILMRATMHGDKALNDVRIGARPADHRPPPEVVPVVAAEAASIMAPIAVSHVEVLPMAQVVDAVPMATSLPANLPLKDMSDLLAKQLGLKGTNVVQTIDTACKELGLPAEGKSLIERAREACDKVGVGGTPVPV